MDIPFDGLVQKDDKNGGMPSLRLTGELKSLSFTAEDAPRRARLFALRNLELVDQARFQVTDQSDIKFVHEKGLDGPVTEMVVLGETVALLAQAKPYLEIATRKSPKASNARTPKRLR